MKHIVTVRTFAQDKENVMKFGASEKTDAFNKAYDYLKNNEHTGVITVDYAVACDDTFNTLTVRLVPKTLEDKQEINYIFTKLIEQEHCVVTFDWQNDYVDVKVETGGEKFCLGRVAESIILYLYKFLGKIEFD